MNFITVIFVLLAAPIINASEIAGKIEKGKLFIDTVWDYSFQRLDTNVANSLTETSLASLDTYLEYGTTDAYSVIAGLRYTEAFVKIVDTGSNSNAFGMESLNAGILYQVDYSKDSFWEFVVTLSPKLGTRKNNGLIQDRTRVNLSAVHEWVGLLWSFGTGLRANISLDETENEAGDAISGGDTVEWIGYFEYLVSDPISMGGTVEYITTADEENNDTDVTTETADQLLIGVYYVQLVTKNLELLSDVKYTFGLADELNGSEVDLADGYEASLGVRYYF